MTIIKRSGKKEEFSIDKVARSMTAAAREAQVPMSDQEVTRMTAEVQRFIGNKEFTTTYEIGVIISGLLYINGFTRLLEFYARHKPLAQPEEPQESK